MNKSINNPYLNKHQFYPPQINETPTADLHTIIVIPCYNEPSIIPTLQSLWDCQRPEGSVEVVIIFNGAKDEKEVVIQNDKTRKATEQWINDHNDERLKYYVLDFPDLPIKHAGVGLARKIGMDEAVSRFERATPGSGVIVCLDADCTCEENYLKTINSHFKDHPKATACSINFEHPLNGNFTPQLYEYIAQYELYLRYYVQGLRYAKHPHAYHTIGSCMAVRSSTYQQQGGMNKRKAGEDFYFLQKIIPLGNFTEINNTTVFPSGRTSDRVPFGTGKAVSDLMESSKMLQVYHPNTFEDLNGLSHIIPQLFNVIDVKAIANILNELPNSLSSFLLDQDINSAIAEINMNCSSLDSFIKRFYRWFNGFKVLKYTHYCRDNFYPLIDVDKAAGSLLENLSVQTDTISTLKDLLDTYKKLDRQNGG